MPDSANIHSLEAIEAFRAKLIVYARRAGNTVDEVSDEVRRLRLWIQQDGPLHWKRETLRRKRKLEEAQQALLAARISALRETTSSERLAVDRARRRYEEAMEKLQAFKRWNHQFDRQVSPLVKEVGKLMNTLTIELPKATAHLAGVVWMLSDYAERHPGRNAMEPQPGAADGNSRKSEEKDGDS